MLPAAATPRLLNPSSPLDLYHLALRPRSLYNLTGEDTTGRDNSTQITNTIPSAVSQHGAYMTQEQKKALERQLWNIADQLRGKMNADEFRDYCLGFIFYKYLSEKQNRYADNILSEDGLKFIDLDQDS
jgi:hypothetical protein